MRNLVGRLVAIAIMATALAGFTATTAAQAAPPSHSSAVAEQAARAPYIYGYYRFLLDCQVVGVAGQLDGVWRSFTCDNRYVQGYFALVILA